MRSVYLSPHLDDAVLSCGGAIHRQTSAGGMVSVVTIFAGEFTGSDLSPFAQEQHRHWGNVPRPMALRRAEDRAALTLLGAEAHPLDYLDAVYRADPHGRWLYPDLDALFGAVHPADLLGLDRVQELADRFAVLLASLAPVEDRPVVYAPLGVGRHVDHQVVHTAARRLLEMGYRLGFYEDYPYAERPAALESAVAAVGAGDWRVEDVPLDAADVAAKVSALGYYRSQMAVLFGGAEMMPNCVWAFAATRSPQVCLAERIWWPPEA